MPLDAIGCQKEVARTIRQQGADYVLAVKENQPRWYEAIERLDEAAWANDDAGIARRGEEERAPGRAERRACGVLTELDGIRDREQWPDLRSIIVVVRERTAGAKYSLEKHYYISSRKRKAKKFLQAIRGHWGIENSLHWVLDVTFEEDRRRLRTDHGPENFALLRRLAVSHLK